MLLDGSEGRSQFLIWIVFGIIAFGLLFMTFMKEDLKKDEANKK